MKNLVIGILTIFFVNCTHDGFDRGLLREQLSAGIPEVTDADIGKLLDMKPNLPKPFKLGVYFMPPQNTSHYWDNRKWRWTEEDKKLILSKYEELKDQGILSDIFTISPMTVRSEDVRSIRMAAARHHADAVLIISGTAQVARYFNNWGASYFLVVTPLFVPGREVDTIFMASSALWDVRNEFLYMTADAETETHETFIPAFGPEDKDLIHAAKSQALAKLGTKIYSRTVNASVVKEKVKM